MENTDLLKGGFQQVGQVHSLTGLNGKGKLAFLFQKASKIEQNYNEHQEAEDNTGGDGKVISLETGPL